MENRILLLISSSLAFLLSCDSKVEKSLYSKGNTWYIFDYDKNDKKFINSNYGYIFNSNNTCNYVLYDFSSDKITEYKNTMSDVKEYNDWKINNNILDIRKKQYQIKKINYDTLILVSSNGNKKIFVNLKNKNPHILPFIQEK